MEALWKPLETHPPPAPLPIGCWVPPRAFGGLRGGRPKRKIRYSSVSPGPPSLHSRFGDGLDGRRQIGSKPAAGDVGSADAPRVSRQAPPTNEPDEPRGPVLGERTLLLLAGNQGTAARRLLSVILVPAITSRRTNRPVLGTGGEPDCIGGGVTRRRPAPCRPRGCASSPKQARRPSAASERRNRPLGCS